MKTTIHQLIILLVIIFVGCSNPSKKELSETEKYNKKYPKYFFESTGWVYLKIYMKQGVSIDTMELEEIYTDIFLVKDSITGKEKRKDDLPWVYLNLYDSDSDFIFRMGKDIYGSNEFFFKNREYD